MVVLKNSSVYLGQSVSSRRSRLKLAHPLKEQLLAPAFHQEAMISLATGFSQGWTKLELATSGVTGGPSSTHRIGRAPASLAVRPDSAIHSVPRHLGRAGNPASPRPHQLPPPGEIRQSDTKSINLLVCLIHLQTPTHFGLSGFPFTVPRYAHSQGFGVDFGSFRLKRQHHDARSIPLSL